MATFDGVNLLITLDTGLDGGILDVLDDLYEPWKEWVLLGNAGFPPAFRPSGGDPLTPGITAGSYTFLRNDLGWRIKPAEEDASFVVTGNLAPQDSTLPIMIPTVGAFTVLAQGLQPITQSVAELFTLQQDSQYEGAVWINTVSGTAGTAYPVGTSVEPVNNLADALVIAARLGVQRINLVGSITLTSAMPFWSIEGVGGIASVDVNGQNLSGAIIKGCGVEGTFGALVAPVVIQGGQINTAGIAGFWGNIAQASIAGDIDLVGDTNILACASGIPGTSHPEIDLGNLDINLGVRDYAGGIGVNSINDPTVSVSIDLLSGTVHLESTVTAGTIVLRGVGHLVDESVGATVLDGLVEAQAIENVKYLVESLRPHHTGHGLLIFWDPVNGNDANDGLTDTTAVATFAAAHALAGDGNHDMIVAYSATPGTVVVDELLHITKDYVFLRGPGRDFQITPTGTTEPTIKVDAVGVEVSGMVVNTAGTGGQNAIQVEDGADFFFVDAVWSRDAQGSAIAINGDTVYGRIDNCFLSHPVAHGIHINGNTRHVRIRQTEIDAAAVDGVRIEGTTARNNIIGDGTKIYACGGYGVNLVAPALRNFIDSDVSIHSNTLGDLLDGGTDTVDERQGDRIGTVEKILRNRLETDPVDGTITIYDDDDATELLSASLWEDVDGTQSYRGQGSERRDRLTAPVVAVGVAMEDATATMEDPTATMEDT